MYFIVKKYLRIGGRNYKPCISYRLSDYLFSTIKELERKGDAEITEKPVFFQNGSRIEQKVPEAGNPAEAGVGSLVEDKPAEDKPAEDKPAEDKPAEDKPVEAKRKGRKNRDRVEEAVSEEAEDNSIEGF